MYTIAPFTCQRLLLTAQCFKSFCRNGLAGVWIVCPI